MKTNLKKRTEGFTIIEVLIVLAIAGLIIAIVLFAVPALQRNGRNTAAKSDASQIAAYISDFMANNDGAIPTPAGSSVTNGAVTINNASGSATKGKIQAGTAVTFQTNSTTAITPTPGSMTAVLGGKCPDTVSGTSVTTVSSTRAAAVVYAIETSSGDAAKCIGV